MKHPCVIPVSSADALAWAAGKLEDTDLILRSPLKPEAVFIINLPNHSAWRPCLRRMLDLYRQGAFMFITRTVNPVVASHLLKTGGVITATENDGKQRYVVPPEAWLKFCRSLTRRDVQVQPKEPGRVGEAVHAISG